MNPSLAAVSTDLRRISYWLYRGQNQLAQRFLDRIKHQYPNLSEQIRPIATQKPDRLKAAEQALTLSRLLYFHSLSHDKI